MTTDPIVKNGELTAEASFILGLILGSWITFRESHDLDSTKIKCCDKTGRLFEALGKYEHLTIGEKGAEYVGRVSKVSTRMGCGRND